MEWLRSQKLADKKLWNITYVVELSDTFEYVDHDEDEGANAPQKFERCTSGRVLADTFVRAVSLVLGLSKDRMIVLQD